jgi:hypothetical protein
METVLNPSMLPAKIAARIRTDAETGCWLWTGYVEKGGYGLVTWPVGSRTRPRTHRLVWELLIGPIPEGMTLDHLCGAKNCCYPRHLEIVTRAENSRRIGGMPNKNGLCRNGRHPWIPANIYIEPSGGQACNRCLEEKRRRFVAAGLRRKARPGSGQQSFL